MRRHIAATILLACVSGASTAAAGNGETFYVGNDAALLAGAVTSTTEGASALWYNPGRIAEGSADSLDLNVAAYALHLGGVPAVVAGTTSASADRTGGFSIEAIPTAVAYKRRIFGWDVGFGLFVPNTRVSYPRSIVQLDGAGGTKLGVDGAEELIEYYAGIGVGRTITPKLSIGFAAFGYYADESQFQTAGVRTSANQFAVFGGSAEDQRFGLQVTWGLSYRPDPALRFGFLVRSPVLSVATLGKQSRFTASGDATGGSADVELVDHGATPRSSILVPARASVGASYDIGRTTTLAIDTRLRAPYSNGTESLGRSAVDFRAGVRTRTSEQVWLGGGLYSDRSTAPLAVDGASSIHFYGGTVGIELGSPYRVLDPKDGKRSTMQFGTTVALSYALGLGTVSNLAVSQRRAELQVEPRRDHVVAHEVLLMVGSTISQLPGW